MAIKPIDMQVLLPKLHKNDLLKPHVLNKVGNEQMMMQNANKQEANERLSRVNEFEQKEDPKVRDEDKRQERENSGKKDKKKDKALAADKKGAPEGRGHIDIKV